jgi:hypothetical protein
MALYACGRYAESYINKLALTFLQIHPSPSVPLEDFPIVDHGWVLNSAGHLLFWVPPWLRDGLYLPQNTLVIAPGTTKLDLSKFVHGTEWQKCIDPEFRDAKLDVNPVCQVIPTFIRDLILFSVLSF